MSSPPTGGGGQAPWLFFSSWRVPCDCTSVVHVNFHVVLTGLGIGLLVWKSSEFFRHDVTWTYWMKKTVFSMSFFLPVKSHQRGKKWQSNLCTIFSWKVTWTLYLLVIRILLSHIHPCLVAKSFRFQLLVSFALERFLSGINSHARCTTPWAWNFNEVGICNVFPFILISVKPD